MKLNKALFEVPVYWIRNEYCWAKTTFPQPLSFVY